MGTRWPGLGDRMRQRLRAQGYWKRGRPDVIRWSLEHGYPPTYTYRWLNEESAPDRDNLLRLAKDLGVTPAWLLFGEDAARRPIAGGCDPGAHEGQRGEPTGLRLIGRWLRERWGLGAPLTPRPALT